MTHTRTCARRAWRGAALLLAWLGGLTAAWAAEPATFVWVPEDANVDRLTVRGELYFEQGRHAEARQCFRALRQRSRLMQNRASAAYGVALCHLATADYEDAATELMGAVDAYAHYLPFAAAVDTEFKLAVEHLDGHRYFLGLFSRDPAAAKVYDHLQRRTAAA